GRPEVDEPLRPHVARDAVERVAEPVDDAVVAAAEHGAGPDLRPARSGVQGEDALAPLVRSCGGEPNPPAPPLPIARLEEARPRPEVAPETDGHRYQGSRGGLFQPAAEGLDHLLDAAQEGRQSPRPGGPGVLGRRLLLLAADELHHAFDRV